MRTRRVRPPDQAVCGWLLALSSTGLAITAHGWAGGGIPGSLLIVPVTVLIAWSAGVLADRLRRMAVLVPVLGVLQLGLHLLLGQSAHAHTGIAPAAPNGAAMLAGHAVATLLAAALLARAAGPLALITSAIDWLRGQLVPLRRPPVPAPTTIGPTAMVPARPGPLLEVLLRRVRARRGPPVHS
ncbi:MAG TPA: hypothetical protein VFV67_21240 [Actinophytocola sp.]|uniref:hypothetical protein n=1 Tax=Actinophytocola sp. TaxID=1872138 RepID=UPI002DBB6539|nr:hypothetical protein [Actinophytocola sp.]HEU5473177.1 hypothetical protein [Actinophytocola sp.]